MAHPWTIGQQPLASAGGPAEGGFLDLDGERVYRIDGAEALPPFLMTVNSASERWMFCSSTGGLTAGVRDPDHALFPYVTDDRLHDAAGRTGSHTVLQLIRGDQRFIWKPFDAGHRCLYRVRERIYRNRPGNLVQFEAVNEDLDCTFRYAWAPTELGFVKRAVVWNHGDTPLEVRVLDGLRNLLPANADPGLQAMRSNLLDAYKKAERVDGNLALFRLSAVPVDRAEPSESLRCTTVWAAGMAGGDGLCLISDRQLEAFAGGGSVTPETDVRGERASAHVRVDAVLGPGAARTWYLVADQDRGPVEVADLRVMLRSPEGLVQRIETAIAAETAALDRITGLGDGLQTTGHEPSDRRHYANVLYNLMRGGVPLNGYRIGRRDLETYLAAANHRVAEAFARQGGDAWDGPGALAALAREGGDPDLERLLAEYLPFGFSRRHGDPSRPWNRFRIAMVDAQGEPLLDYEGNWRDLFQNWEALAYAWPDFLPGMIARFLNASTADGYNPYRVTRDGIDWEVIEPDDPWSYIGYWGDHQIVYLLKLLEADAAHHPGRLSGELGRRTYAYADVPYRIAGFDALWADPRNTVTFDEAAEAAAEARVAALGGDGRLVPDGAGIRRATLAEKLLLPLLVKVGNLVPGGGIWLNTQRPEWNDANNALVGLGLSVVTVAYLRRYAAFLRGVFAGGETVTLHGAVADLFEALDAALPLALAPADDAARYRATEAFGRAAETHREAVYAGRYGEPVAVPAERLAAFLDALLPVLDDTLRSNRREDGLYHAYNRMRRGDGTLGLERFEVMLEGQVAILSAGLLEPSEAADLLDALRVSALYREDQRAYLLYPDRDLPRFTEANVLPDERVASSPLLQRLLDDPRGLVRRDALGAVHFHPDCRNAADLDRLAEGLPAEERAELAAHWEAVFHHDAFTGRSGTFFAYEGLGSVYWHMHSKLLLAVQENALAALEAGHASGERLAAHYRAVRSGLGWDHDPATYGAFPCEPYSHTPAHRGAQQPGMTGQVKEDILCRWGELGVMVREGRLAFRPRLLQERDGLPEDATLSWHAPDGSFREAPLAPGELGFTYCGVPVRYRRGGVPELRVRYADGSEATFGDGLSAEDSRAVFARRGTVAFVEVTVG